ncbi:hypothetical protein D3C78_1357760 [compost metagenome]
MEQERWVDLVVDIDQGREAAVAGGVLIDLVAVDVQLHVVGEVHLDHVIAGTTVVHRPATFCHHVLHRFHQAIEVGHDLDHIAQFVHGFGEADGYFVYFCGGPGTLFSVQDVDAEPGKAVVVLDFHAQVRDIIETGLVVDGVIVDAFDNQRDERQVDDLGRHCRIPFGVR